MSRRPPTRVAALLGVLLAAGPAGAETLTTTFEVRLDVANRCSLAAVGPVDFGTASAAGGGELAAFGSLLVQCNFPTVFTITLDGGLHGTPAARRMLNAAGDSIAYRLHSGADGTCSAQTGAIWGDGSGGTCTLSASHPGNGVDRAIPLEGRLTLSNPAAGRYGDTVTATITY